MNFSFSPEQLQVQQIAKQFAGKELLPFASQFDEQAQFPSEALKKLGALGFMGMMIPQEWGGAGFDATTYLLALIEISKACASTAVTLSVHNSLFNHLVFTYGTQTQKEKYLLPFAKGEKLGAYALTEPHTGSDAAAIQCRATLSGSEYIIEGQKTFISSGPHADAFILYARTAAHKTKGISAFIVERNFEGFLVGKIEKKMGMNASSTSELILDSCRVPKENLLGKEGEGFSIAMSSLDRGRLGVAAQALGIGWAAFEAARNYAKQREAFGKKIYEFGTIQNYLADMACRLESSQLVLFKAAYLLSENQPFSKHASMAKLMASEAAHFVTDKAVQIHGGYGYIKDFPVERYYREAKVTEIYEGTSEIQRLVICRELMKEMGE